MKRIKGNPTALAATLVALLGLSACGPESDSTPKKTPEKASESHEGEKEHADEDKHGHAGEKHALGQATVGSYVVNTTQIGDADPGAEAVFEIVVSGGDTSDLAVRLWIGTEDGKGSMKQKAGSEEAGHYHCHVDVPDSLSQGSKLWVEIERSADGSKVGKGSFTLKTEHK